MVCLTVGLSNTHDCIHHYALRELVNMEAYRSGDSMVNLWRWGTYFIEANSTLRLTSKEIHIYRRFTIILSRNGKSISLNFIKLRAYPNRRLKLRWM